MKKKVKILGQKRKGEVKTKLESESARQGSGKSREERVTGKKDHKMAKDSARFRGMGGNAGC